MPQAKGVTGDHLRLWLVGLLVFAAIAVLFSKAQGSLCDKVILGMKEGGLRGSCSVSVPETL